MLYLVGDLQGCSDALERLLALIGFSPSRDRLVVLGDLVNRGPGSLAVLRRLHGFGDAATCLLGNHDLHLLAVAKGARQRHRGDTFGDVLDDPQAQAHLEWLRARPLACTAGGWLCVHAGLVPQWSAADALALAAEVSAMLQGEGLGEFVHAMYGDSPARWDPALAGLARWRFVVNVLTRIRFCTADGVLDLKTKEGAGAAPAGFMPWFDVPARRSAGERVACGHWSTLGLVDRPDLLAIDTGCVWGGALTAVRVDGGRREIIQVPCAPQQQLGA
ncbi:MAG: symmetrical bis(5'-nucleosyl)-tetraphosphatase [Rubrivivax sp.]|nr:symmetrical bis(5'-nucleosyl)-tetraphosphatase [Rubrivivax sp.]